MPSTEMILVLLPLASVVVSVLGGMALAALVLSRVRVPRSLWLLPPGVPCVTGVLVTIGFLRSPTGGLEVDLVPWCLGFLGAGIGYPVNGLLVALTQDRIYGPAHGVRRALVALGLSWGGGALTAWLLLQPILAPPPPVHGRAMPPPASDLLVDAAIVVVVGAPCLVSGLALVALIRDAGQPARTAIVGCVMGGVSCFGASILALAIRDLCMAVEHGAVALIGPGLPSSAWTWIPAWIGVAFGAVVAVRSLRCSRPWRTIWPLALPIVAWALIVAFLCEKSAKVWGGPLAYAAAERAEPLGVRPPNLRDGRRGISIVHGLPDSRHFLWPPRGNCIVERVDGQWRTSGGNLSGGCPVADGPTALPLAPGTRPLVAVRGDTPALLLANTEWYLSGGSLYILVRSVEERWDERLEIGSLRIGWLPDLPRTARGASMVEHGSGHLGASLGVLYLVPGPLWTVQDLVDLCVERTRYGDCVLLTNATASTLEVVPSPLEADPHEQRREP